MPGQDGSRAISTINFLLDDKAPGAKLEHTWNAHLKTACRDDTRGSLNLLNLFTSDGDEPADSAAADPNSSTALQDASPPQEPSPAASSEGPRLQLQQRQQPLPAEAATGGPAPACHAATAGGAQTAAPSTPAQDAAAASTVQETVSTTTAAADGALAAASCTPQLLSGSSDSKGSGQAEAAPAQQHSSPTPEQPANGVITAAAPPTSVLNPMQAATGVKPAAESPAPPAQVEDGDAEEEYRKVHKALDLLRHVQASTKLPQCLQPPKRPQLMPQSTPVPAANTASTGSNSSRSGGVSMVVDAATRKPSTAAAGSQTPAGDGVYALLTGGRSSSTNDSHSSAAGKLHLPLGACTSSASFSNGPKGSRVPAQQPQPHDQPHRSRSFTSPTAAVAAVGAPSSAAAPAAPAGRHTNGAVANITSSSSSSSASVPLAALHAPTLEDLKPYLKGATSGEGVEAFIQRRLQQPPDVTCPAGAKLSKLPASERYMATIAVEHCGGHKQRQQLQRLPSAAAGEQRRQRG